MMKKQTFQRVMNLNQGVVLERPEGRIQNSVKMLQLSEFILSGAHF